MWTYDLISLGISRKEIAGSYGKYMFIFQENARQLFKVAVLFSTSISNITVPVSCNLNNT